MIIKIVRHGESEANVLLKDPTSFPDSKICLTDKGVKQAINAGKEIGADFLSKATLYRSPYYRTRETSVGLMVGAELENRNWIEDVRLREIEIGYTNREPQESLRKSIGWFYYRFNGGESPADVFLRASTFIDDMLKLEHEKVVIVGHGMTNRLLIMSLLHLTVEEYEKMVNPPNCEVITVYTEKDIEVYEKEKALGITKPILFEDKNRKTIVCSNMEKYNHPEVDFDKEFRERALEIKKTL